MPLSTNSCGALPAELTPEVPVAEPDTDPSTGVDEAEPVAEPVAAPEPEPEPVAEPVDEPVAAGSVDEPAKPVETSGLTGSPATDLLAALLALLMIAALVLLYFHMRTIPIYT